MHCWTPMMEVGSEREIDDENHDGLRDWPSKMSRDHGRDSEFSQSQK